MSLSTRDGATAFAQMGPGNLPGPSSPTGEEPKPEGVAEAAPKGEGVLPSTPVLPPPKTRRKKFELFQLDGYYRLRTDWFKNFNLGFESRTVSTTEGDFTGGAPFPRALGCQPTVTANQNCSDTLKSTNMRLRLEPTITLTETTSVHMQLDFLDNVVLGSTPVGSTSGVENPGNIPLHAFAGGQAVPEQDKNSLSDALLVRRAWAEVDSPLVPRSAAAALVGTGTFNAGGYDP
jgi:hypothetical protein